MNFLSKSALFVLGLSAVAEANADWWYKETPSFLSNQHPNEFTCHTNGLNHSGKLIVNCYPKGIDAKEQVLVKTADGRVQVEYHDTVTVVDCQQGLCVDKRYGDYMGRVDLSRIPDDVETVIGLDFIKVFSGYYIHLNEDDVMSAYRFGTGPLAADFPIPMIEDDADAFYHDLTPAGSFTHNAPTIIAEQGPSMTGGYNDGTYDLWCNPRSDYCHYTADDGSKYKLTRDELLDYIPLAADTSDCMMEVCVNADMEVIGLNPSYSIFK